ncbi:MAG: MXAN_6577-like cysteine-rich protein [Polyangiales bacterium]
MSVVVVVLGCLLLAGCLPAEPSAPRGPAPCADGGTACPALAGFAVACEEGRCVARTSSGEALADCAGDGRYAADLRHDARNCGACGFVCPTSTTCEGGACGCAAGEARCDGACVPVATSRAHCGACGHACAEGERCASGVCARCPAGEVTCGDRCVRLATAWADCGACGRRCGGAERCADGACVPCPAGQLACDGACTDVRADGAHCGACGARCGRNQICFEGECRLSLGSDCPVGLRACGGRCTDPQSDAAHCGGCGVACPAGTTCVDGACACPAGGRLCDGRCVDPQSDAAHCGGCGVACPAGTRCDRGLCPCPEGTVRCRDRCVDLRTDASNCGACERYCGDVCSEGRCLYCARHFACAGVCVDRSTDHGHCGACGRACGPAEACSGGACVACPPGRATWCARGGCVDLATSDMNCGACGAACPYLWACVAGRCVEPCDAGTSLAHSDMHCGACGAPCAAGTLCLDGRCASATPRLKAPIATAVVTSARPWFRWELPAGADGARVEVCAARACDRVEASWEAPGDRLRAPAALAPGVHHWRAYARRGGRYDATPSIVWEFVVPAPVGVGGGYLADLNGDGAVDGAARVGRGDDGCVADAGCVDVRYGVAGAGAPPASQRISGPNILRFDEFTTYPTLVGAGVLPDLNGDGFGELLLATNFRRIGAPGLLDYQSGDLRWGASSGVAVVSRGFGGRTFRDGLVDSTPQAFYFAGDRDGDGYGDVATLPPTADGYSEFLGGRATFRGGTFALSADAPSGFRVGDFDADGRSDLVYWGAYGRARVTMGAATLPDLPDGPEIAECAARLADPFVRFDAVVRDENDDGYDDLTYTVRDASRGVVSRIFGGPDGLPPSRCTLLP